MFQMVPCDSEQQSPKGSAMGVNGEIGRLGQEGYHLGEGYKLVIPHFEKVTNRTTNMLSYYTFTLRKNSGATGPFIDQCILSLFKGIWKGAIHIRGYTTFKLSSSYLQFFLYLFFSGVAVWLFCIVNFKLKEQCIDDNEW